MNREEMSTYALRERALLDELKASHEATLRETKGLFTRPGQREVGEHNGVNLGTVTLANGPKTYKVTNPGAFEAWVSEYHPDALVTTINPAWQKAFLDRMKATGGFDERTGEQVPGVDLVEGAPRLVVSVSDDARSHLAEIGAPVRPEVES